MSTVFPDSLAWSLAATANSALRQRFWKGVGDGIAIVNIEERPLDLAQPRDGWAPHWRVDVYKQYEDTARVVGIALSLHFEAADLIGAVHQAARELSEGGGTSVRDCSPLPAPQIVAGRGSLRLS